MQQSVWGSEKCCIICCSALYFINKVRSERDEIYECSRCFTERVIGRDIAERGRTAEDVMKRYVNVLKPMHQQFIEPCKRYADLIVPEGGNNQVAIDILTMYIKKHLNK